MSFLSAASFARKVAYPWLAKKADNVVDSTLQYAANAPEHLEGWVPESGQTLHQWLRDPVGEQKLAGTWQRIKQEFIDPQMVMGNNEFGQKIIESGTKGELEYGKFLHKYVPEFEKVSRGIKRRSEEAGRIFQALEDPTIQLSAKEQPTRDYLKNFYDYIRKVYTNHLVGGDETSYNKVMKLASQGEEIDPTILETLSEQEANAYDFARRKIANFAPHLWDREVIVEKLQDSLQKFQQKLSLTKSEASKATYIDKIKVYQESLNKLNANNPLTWDSLPGDFLFKHELERKGAVGFQEDAIQSFYSYLFSLGKKMYKDPAIKKMVENYKELPFYQKPYAKWFIRDYAGYNKKTVWDDLASKITSFEYIRLLGANLRSPIVNLTQQLNTIVDAGPKWSKVGYVKMFTPEFKAMWEKTGLGLEIPQALTEDLGDTATRQDKLKRILMFAFNKAEEFNRRHAFATYYSKFEHLGEAEATRKAIEGVHKTQFQYGKVGMPKILRTPVGRVGGQFSSFTIKQAEFLWNLAKDDPKKLLTWIGASGGLTYGLGELLGIDLSSTLGFGVNLGEAVDMLRSASKGELGDAWTHGRLAIAEGSGILPSGPGPAISSAGKIIDAVRKGEDILPTLWKQLKPVAWQRVDDLLTSLQNKGIEEGKYGVFKETETLGQFAPGVFGPRVKEKVSEQSLKDLLTQPFFQTSSRTEKRNQQYRETLLDKRDLNRKHEIARLIVDGNGKSADEKIKKWQVVPSKDMVYEEYLRRNIPREYRQHYIKLHQRQLKREALEQAEEETEE